MRPVKQLLVLLLCLSALLLSACGSSARPQDTEGTSSLQYIFVHGLSGWGSYDKVNRFFPYWGTRNGYLMFRKTSRYMGAYTGTTAGGMAIDDRWRENDGLVNTISSLAPFGAPATAYDPADIQPGVWNEMPVFPGDHMSIIGGMTIKTEVLPFYLELLQMIDALPVT